MDFLTLDLLLRCNREYSHRELRSQNVNDSECMICTYVYSNPGCSQDDAAWALKMDKTTVAKALLALETKGYVQRVQDAADKRVKRLCVTDAGREKITALIALHDRWLSQVLTCLSASEQAQFESYCQRVLLSAQALAETQKTGGTK